MNTPPFFAIEALAQRMHGDVAPRRRVRAHDPQALADLGYVPYLDCVPFAANK